MVVFEILNGLKNWVLDLISDVRYKKYFDERYMICSSCENNGGGICKICHCVLKLKTKSENSECPEGKWKTIKDTIDEL